MGLFLGTKNFFFATTPSGTFHDPGQMRHLVGLVDARTKRAGGVIAFRQMVTHQGL